MDSAKASAHSTSVLTKLSKGIVNFVKQPRLLFWLFIVLNLVPNFCLLFTEPLSGLGKTILILLPLGVYMVVFSLFKRAGLMQLILIPVLILHAFQLVLFYLFGESVIAVDMFLNLPTTNASEAGELLGNIWPSIIIVCVLYIPVIVLASIAVHHKVRRTAVFRKHMITWGIIFFIIGSGLVAFEKHRDNTYEVKTDIYPANVMYNLYYAGVKWNRSMNYPVTSKDFVYHATRDSVHQRREIYVLVIGEAGRAENWELWGYQRETNPLLKNEDNLILYKDALTQSNTTHKSVPLILSAADACHYEYLYTHKSIVTAFKEAGFKTIFLSNQTPNRSFTDYFAAEADIHVNVRPQADGGLITVNKFDGEMLPLIQQYVDSLSENLFIVFHTYGSHFNYKERYPEEFAKFQPANATEVEYKNKDQLINAYDNSVLYTDYFLHSLIGILKNSEADATMIYSPDHGEDLLDDNRKRFLHASPIPTYYQIHIPFLMWFSENYIDARPEKYEVARYNSSAPISSNASIFHTLLNLHGFLACVSVLLAAYFISSSDWLMSEYLRIESRFLVNLNEKHMRKHRESAPDDSRTWFDEDLQLVYYDLQNDSSIIGKTLRSLGFRESYGCNVLQLLGSNRTVDMPGGEQIVEKGDKLLLIGTASQLQVFDAAVRQRSLGLERCDLPQSLREFMLDNHQNKPEQQFLSLAITIDKHSPILGTSLKAADLRNKWSCLVVGLERGAFTITNPHVSLVFEENDLLWVLGKQKMMNILIREEIL